jgi:hypothetical protein
MPERVINGNTFQVEALPAMRSFALQARIAPALGEVIGVAAGILTGGGIDTADVAELAPVLGRFFAKLPSAELQDVTRELLTGATMDGVPLFTSGQGDPFDLKMRGRTLDVWKLLWFSLEVNYPDFFGLLAARGERQKEEGDSEG